MMHERNGWWLPWIVGFALLSTAGQLRSADSSPESGRERRLFDFGWRFHLGNDWGVADDLVKAGACKGPARAAFSDASWRTLDLPHDWAIELPFDQKADGSHGFKPVGPGFETNSVGWYRRQFTLPREDLGKRLWVEFDGAYRDTRVFVNGYHVGHHESGYSSFRYDITDLVKCGATNAIAVRVDASQFEGWFYEGAGIYRHVWLVKTAPVAIVPDGVLVRTQFKGDVPNGPASVEVQATVRNAEAASREVVMRCEILDPADKRVATAKTATARLAPGTAGDVTQRLRLAAPQLWSPETPNLYKLVTTVEVGGRGVDRVTTEFGIRTVGFDPDRGFLLNGKPYVLKGTCNHQDHAGVGAALPDRLQYFRIARLKEMGGNAYRSSHNPPTPELLEACDRLGMLVMDENRLLGSDAANLARLEGLVRRDRNHASVAIWSIGNEEGVQTTPTGGRIGETMQNLVHSLDPTRPVTMAANVGNDFGGLNRIIDVRGWNYHIGPAMDDYHREHPRQPNVGTEQASTVCTRGIYANDKEHGYVSAYDENAPPWAHTTETWWKFFAARPWLSGGFAWTGFDYRGEPTPYWWPCINSHFGILDTCGFPKDNFFYYQAWWGARPMLHLLPHWNWPGKEGQEIDVRCFSNCDEVELFLNGASLGKQTIAKNSHAAWKVKYAAGTLKAVGYSGGKVAAEDRRETTGPAGSVKLEPDRAQLNADGEDLSIITVSIVDAQGRSIPTANLPVRFELTGPGRILGVGNGDPSCHEPDVFVERPSVRALTLNDWKYKQVPDVKDRPEVANEFPTTDWRAANVRSDYGELGPGAMAVFRTRIAMTAADLAAPNITAVFGTIDDEGQVYVNGKLVAKTDDWANPQRIEIRRFLQAGENEIAVVVKNRAGQGGLGKGVEIQIAEERVKPAWGRSVFNGLAQVLVQTRKEAGEIKLTARAEGLSPAQVSLTSRECQPRPCVPSL